jgi:hypothetical protein
MKKEIFDTLTTDQKFSVISLYQTLHSNAVSSRMSLLPLIAGLTISLLVVATFNNNLFPLDDTIRFIISLLLVIAPISLYFYNKDLVTAQEETLKTINLLLVLEKQEVKGVRNLITRWLPDVLIFILFCISLTLISKIWELQFFCS